MRLRALRHSHEYEEEIPDIHPDLHAVGVGLAVIGGLHELHIRLVPCIHVSQCNAGTEYRAKYRAKRGPNTSRYETKLQPLLDDQCRIARDAAQIRRDVRRSPIRSQPGTLPLLRRLLAPLRLFLLRLVRFRCSRRGLLVLWLRRRTRFRRRRSTALGLRTLARRRSLRPLSRLIPSGRRLPGWLGRRRAAHFWSSVWLRCRRTIRFRPIVWLRRRRTIRFRPIVWLRRRRTIRFRPVVRLGCRRSICFQPVAWVRRRGAVHFRPVVWLRRPVGASGTVPMRGRRIGRWLSCGTIDWRVIRRSCRCGRHDGAVVKCSRLGSSRDCRLAMVHGSPLLRIRAGSLRMLSLNRYSWNMVLAS